MTHPTPPRHGDKAYCAVCGKRIRYSRAGWVHAKRPTWDHRAVPKEEERE